MPDIKVKFYATLRKKAGRDEFSCRADTVKDVLSRLKQELGNEIAGHVKACNVFLNSDNITTLRGPLTRLKDGDTVHIFPPMGGG